jgi:hypothetical protein
VNGIFCYSVLGAAWPTEPAEHTVTRRPDLVEPKKKGSAWPLVAFTVGGVALFMILSR